MKGGDSFSVPYIPKGKSAALKRPILGVTAWPCRTSHRCSVTWKVELERREDAPIQAPIPPDAQSALIAGHPIGDGLDHLVGQAQGLV